MRKRLTKPPLSWLIIAIIVVGIALIGVDLLDGTVDPASAALIVAAPIAIFSMIRWVVPWQMRRQFAQSAAIQDEHQLSFDSSSITFDGSRGSVTIPMKEFHAFSETESSLLLHQTEAFFNIVPKTALGDALPELITALKAADVKQI